MIRKEVLELKEKIIQHLDNEMKLVDEMQSIDLTEEENEFLVKAHFNHPYAKKTEKTFNINMKEWVDKIVSASNIE